MKQWIGWLVFFTTVSTFAAQDFIPIQEKAQGQALSGSIQTNESLYSNPAASSFVNIYSIDGSLSLPRSFAVSVLDTQTSGFGGAIGYYRKAADSDYFSSETASSKKWIQGAKLALMGKLSNTIGIGVSGKSIWGPDSLGKDSKVLDADVGVLFNGGLFQLGAVLRNVLGGKESMRLSREYSIGGKISYDQILSLSVATQANVNSATPYQVGVGAEYVSPYYFGLRGGYRFSTQENINFWSVGASFISPRLSLHYALEMPSQPNTPSDHMLGTTILF